MDIIKERCAEESDSFVDSIIDLIESHKYYHKTLDTDSELEFEKAKKIASKKARDLSKCILKKQEY